MFVRGQNPVAINAAQPVFASKTILVNSAVLGSVLINGWLYVAPYPRALLLIQM